MNTVSVSGIRSGTRILLVEDNDTSRQLMSDYLNYHGWQVLSLGRGSSFTSAIAQFNPDLILLDLKLPDIDGYALLQLLQHHPDWQRIPAIVISAFAFQAERQRAMQLGARRYFVKPLNLAQLRQVIEEELQHQFAF